MTTPNFGIEEWIQDQSQPHVTVNTALRIFDCLVQLRVLDRDATAPPAASPNHAEGDCYIVASSGATGDWAGHENDVAMYIGSTWVFRTPRTGWVAWVLDEAIEVRYRDDTSPSGWV